MKRSVCQCGGGDAITMSTSPVYLNASPQEEGVGIGQGVGVGVKVCSTGCRSSCEFGGEFWSWKHSKKHHNVLVYISSCRWNVTPRSWVCRVKGLEKLVEH
jgi:hypothetical protein